MDHPSPHCQYHVRCLKAGVRTWPMRFASWYMGLESPSACLFTAASPPPSSPPKPSFCRTAPISWQLSCQWRNYQGSLWKKRVDICLIFLDISTRIFCKINSYSYLPPTVILSLIFLAVQGEVKLDMDCCSQSLLWCHSKTITTATLNQATHHWPDSYLQCRKIHVWKITKNNTSSIKQKYLHWQFACIIV